MKTTRSSLGHGQAGFTILEILIAIVVLMVGLTGILAVFPAALGSARRSVEDTYAGAIAQSVLDAIHLGLKETRVTLNEGTNDELSFFIFDHDGVLDLEKDWKNGDLRDIRTPSKVTALQAKDYFVLLPRTSETGGDGKPRAYLYPRDKPGVENQNRQGTREVDGEVAGRKVKKLEVKKTYVCGRKLAESTIEEDKDDPYPQYSFAFTIRPGRAPQGAGGGTAVVPGLYEVLIKVYRNFEPDPNLKRYDPIREFVTLVSVE